MLGTNNIDNSVREKATSGLLAAGSFAVPTKTKERLQFYQ
jgi:hypothetical protein